VTLSERAFAPIRSDLIAKGISKPAVEALKGALDSGAGASTDIGPLTARVTALEGRMTTAEGGITALQTRMTAAEADIAVLQDDAAKTGFGWYNEGVYANNEFLGETVWPHDVVFTDGDADTIVTAGPGFAATATAVYRLTLADLTQVGTITFAAAALTGTVAWDASPYTHPAGAQLLLYSPLVADATLGNVTGRITGRVA